MTLPEGLNFFKPKAGTYLLDIVPYEVKHGNPFADPGQLHYERTYYTHPRLGVQKNSYVCLAKTFNKKCPVCEEQFAMSRDPDADDGVRKSLLPKERQLFLVYVHQEAEKGLQLWEFSNFNFGKLLDSRIENSDEDEGYADFYWPEATDYEGENGEIGGMSLKITFEEETMGGGGTFVKATAIDFKKRAEDLPEEIAEHGFFLDDMVKEQPYEIIHKALHQLDEEEDAEDEEEKPKKSARAVGKSRASTSTKAARPSKKSSKKKEPEPEEEMEVDADFLREQGELADDGDDDAMEALRDRGEAVGLEEAEFPTWAEFAEAIIAEEEDEEDGGPSDDEEEEPDDDDDWDDEEEDEPAPKKTMKKTSTRKKKEPEPEPDDDDDDWDDEPEDGGPSDDEEEEPDDDDDWDDEEEDEPSPPKRKRAAGKSSASARTAKKKSTKKTTPGSRTRSTKGASRSRK